MTFSEAVRVVAAHEFGKAKRGSPVFRDELLVLSTAGFAAPKIRLAVRGPSGTPKSDS